MVILLEWSEVVEGEELENKSFVMLAKKTETVKTIFYI